MRETLHVSEGKGGRISLSEDACAFRIPKPVGHWIIVSQLTWEWPDRPNRRQRCLARWLLGWRWVDAAR